ncbi:MAG: AraC family transcriptional regulator [Clostridia bacterium]|nr:AraC family transcriptional regulator [Clostridia bacterium]
MVFDEYIIEKSYADIIPILFGYENCAPGHSFGPAIREYWLIHYVESGFGKFSKGGNTYTVEPGQMFVIRPDEVTLYAADEKNPWTYHWVAFFCAGDMPLDLPPVITCPEAGELFERIKNSRGLENGMGAQIRGLIWQIFSLLMEQHKQQTDYIHVAVRFMSTEYVNCITVKDVAERLGLNRSYFSDYFKKNMGISPQRFLMNIRMTKAAEMLLAGIKPSVAATSVGYEDLFAFSKAFKRHFGVSPREYAKQNKLTQ